MEYDYRDQVKICLLPEDFAGEALYSFGWLPENKRRNDEIIARATERALQRTGHKRGLIKEP